MDMFMDKLAQKLNAQEIIKANAAAEAEELGKLRDRLSEYNECLDRLQKLIEEGAAKLDGIQGNGEEVNRLVAESIEKIQSMQQETQSLDEIQTMLTEQLLNLDKSIQEKFAGTEENVHKECVKVYRNVQAVVVEENSKLSEALDTASSAVTAQKKKLSAVFGIAIASLIISIGGLALEILQLLNIKLF